MTQAMLQCLANAYMRTRHTVLGQVTYHRQPYTEPFYRAIATAYDALPMDDGGLPATVESYLALGRETVAMFECLQVNGIRFDWTSDNPYETEADMLRDITNNHLTVFTGGTPNRLMTPFNRMFRAVHDVFGHGTTQSLQDAQGEEQAYAIHYQMYSPAARPALAMETRGQNVWLNFGPRAHLDRPFADQKLALLPSVYLTIGD